MDYVVTGTATGGGVDYTLADATATISAGATTTTIPVIVVNDALYENNETIIVTGRSPSNATLGSDDVHTYTITNVSGNDDKPTIDFNATAASYAEGSGTPTATVDLSAAAGLSSSINYTVAAGSPAAREVALIILLLMVQQQ